MDEGEDTAPEAEVAASTIKIRREFAAVRSQRNFWRGTLEFTSLAAAIAGAAGHATLGALRQKYSYGGRYELYRTLTGEIQHAVEGVRVS